MYLWSSALSCDAFGRAGADATRQTLGDSHWLEDEKDILSGKEKCSRGTSINHHNNYNNYNKQFKL